MSSEVSEDCRCSLVEGCCKCLEVVEDCKCLKVGEDCRCLEVWEGCRCLEVEEGGRHSWEDCSQCSEADSCRVGLGGDSCWRGMRLEDS